MVAVDLIDLYADGCDVIALAALLVPPPTSCSLNELPDSFGRVVRLVCFADDLTRLVGVASGDR